MKRKNWWLVLILLLAAGLRFFRLDARSLWFDEALSVLIGRLTLYEAVTGAAGSSHPPGYYLLMHLWQALGTSDWLLRYPSVFVSVLSVSLTYRLGVSLFERRAGLVAALGMAVAPLQVYYAQEARMYGLATALTLGAVCCMVCGLTLPRRAVAWMGYGLFAVLGLYTHYFVAWVVLAAHVWLLAHSRRFRSVWLPLLLTDLVVGLAFVPQVVQFLGQARDYLTGSLAWQARPHPLSPLVTLEYLLFGHGVRGVLWWWGARVTLVLTITALVVLEWVRRRERGWRRRAGLLLLVVVFPLFAVLVISWTLTPIYLERSFVMIAPFLMLFLAQGIAATPSRFSPTPWVSVLLCVLLLAGTVVHFAVPDIAKPPVREAMSVVAEGFREGDLCVHVDETYLSALVYQPGLSPALYHIEAWKMRPSTYQVLGGRLVTSDEVLAAKGRLWLVLAGRSSQPWEALLERIDREREVEEVWQWELLTVYLYD
jgi:mannosyltransferase